MAGPISFEECPMSHRDFDRDGGVFSCQESGVYSLALSSLMKSDNNKPVTIRISVADRNGKVRK